MEKPKVVKINPLTPLQSGMLFYSVLDEAGQNYHQQNLFALEGVIDIPVLKAAWQTLIDRHEIFRTDFRWKKLDNPVQIVLNRKEAEMAELDFSALDEREQSEAIAELTAADLARGFDFENGRVNRITFAKIHATKYLVIWTFHHILLDGWSIPFVLKDFFAIYHALQCGLPLPPPPVAQFSDYLDWFKRRNRDEGQRFWREYLRELEEPTLVANPAEVDAYGVIREVGTIRFEIVDAKRERLQQFCRELNITLNALIETAWGILLQRYNNTRTSCFGMTVSGRPAEVREVEKIVGLLINTLPVVVQTNAGECVQDLLTRVNLKLVEMRKYEYFSLADLVQLTGLQQKQRCFDSIIVFENYPLQTALDESKSDFQMTLLSAHELTNYDLTITVSGSEKIGLVFDYNPTRMNAGRIQQMGENLLHLIEEMVQYPDREVEKLPLLGDSEAARICACYRGEERPVPQETVQELFVRQVAKTPDKVALSYRGQQITYEELNAKANQLARILIQRGLQKETIAILILERSPEWVISLLAVLKAGGAFLPLDPGTPEERVRCILTESKAKIVLTQSSGVFQNAPSDETQLVEVLRLDQLEDALAAEVAENLPCQTTSRDLAYVIYTSGSTGQPKGVMIEQRSIVNLINWFQQRYPAAIHQNVLQMSNVAFDVAYEEVLTTLCAGGTLYMPAREEFLDPGVFDQYLRTGQIHLAQFVPVTLQELLLPLAPIPSLKTVIVGGDRLPDDLKEAILAKGYTLHNHYGPTETTIDALACQCSGEKVTLGQPIANLRVYVVSESNTLQPFGVPGELCIGGMGLARGYLNRPDLTAEKFCPDPWNLGERLYRTGDRVCWHANGQIEFLGRLDQQVKIRGFRIELGEIESRLRNYPDLADAVVIDREDAQGEKYLCAYVIARQRDFRIDFADVKAYLRQYLPPYMVPASFAQLEELPVTPSGKVDRKALAAQEFASDGAELVKQNQPPTTKLEHTLARIWEEILGVKQVGVLDHFFELGGHSLKATQLVSRVLKEAGLELPVGRVFATPTIQGLASYLEEITATVSQTDAEKRSHGKVAPIPKAPAQDYYPVSSAQKRLYILDQLGGKNLGYNMPGALEIVGDFDLSHLEEVCRKLIERHEALRTSFVMVQGVPVERIHSDVEFAIRQITVPAGEVAGALEQFVQPFDLAKAPLLRMAVVSSADRTILLYDLHHIIADGLSLQILTREIQALYAGQELAPLGIQYKDFAVWQEQLFHSGEMKKQEEHWLQVFQEGVPVLNLATDYPRPAVFQMEGSVQHYQLDPALSRQLQELALRQGVTVYMLMLAFFNLLLYRYSGQEDLVVGSPVAGRAHVDLEGIIGMFVNTLALRNRPRGEQSFRDFLLEVKTTTIQAFENQDYLFEMLIDKLHPDRVLNRNPLFDVMFVMQSNSAPGRTRELEREQAARTTFTPIFLESGVAKYDLVLNVFQGDAGLHLAMEYCTKLFTSSTVERMLGHLANLTRAVVVGSKPGEQVEGLQMKLADFVLISPEERHQLLVTFNGRKETYPDTMVYQLFEEQVRRTPEQPALQRLGLNVTYQELNARANQLARWLRRRGAGREQVIALLFEPSLEMVVAMLGIWKAGGAYLPVDPAYPVERIGYMIADSGTQLVLTAGSTAQLAARLSVEHHWTVEWYDIAEPAIYAGDSSNLPPANDLPDLAYLIYTSGSTGKPKGVLTEQRGIRNTVHWRREEYQLTERDRALMPLSYAFDGFTLNLWTVLTSGVTLVFLSADECKDPVAIQKVIGSYAITYLVSVPSFYAAILEAITPDSFRSMQKVVFGGEKVPFHIVQETRQKNPTVEIINDYGPTECSVQATVARHLERDTVVTIGKPVANTEVYICDRQNQLLPIGVVGELCLAGEGLARGYHGLPELTAERFVENPFRPGSRMYRTGDLARWLLDGRIEFIGRLDQQVKIRGFRIETGEIEAALLAHPEVQEAVVIEYAEEKGQYSLCAYYVSAQGVEVQAEILQAFVARSLPEYMIPTYFIQLAALPLTPIGKLDRKALPEPERLLRPASSSYVAPTHTLEHELALIWQEILAIERAGVEDNFFTLGGHSLKAASLVSRVYKEYGVELPVREVFQHPTIRELADYLLQQYPALLEKPFPQSYTLIERVPERPVYPASSGQKRIYAVQQQARQNTSYNMPGVLVIHGDLQLERLQQALQRLILRHESLRTCFAIQDGEIVQQVKADVEFQVRCRKLHLPLQQPLHGEAGSWEEEQVHESVHAFIRPFDLSEAPLFRVELVEVADRSYLLYDLHHIIADGLSVQIMMQEMFQLYQGEELPPLRLQYRDYAVWQERLFASPELDQQEAYWLDQLQDLVYTEFPHKNAVPTGEPESAESGIILEVGLQRKMTEFCHASGITRCTLVLAVFQFILAKKLNQPEVSVGIPVSGRRDPDLEAVIGLFLNLVTIRTKVEPELSFADYVKQVNDTWLSAYENQDYPYERLLDLLKEQCNFKAGSLFSILFNYQTVDRENVTGQITSGEIRVAPYEAAKPEAKYDLTLYVGDLPRGLEIKAVYRKECLEEHTIGQILAAFPDVLAMILEDPAIPLRALKLAQPQEQLFQSDFDDLFEEM